MRRSIMRLTLPLAACALTGGVLPIGGLAAYAAPSGGEPAFSGYAADAWATPVQLQVYEPTIPIPAEPQAELEYGYSRVEADSTSSLGRASYLWPGDSVGEGFKTFVEQLGFPPSLGEDGYPAQVNAKHPSGPDFESDEPLPGSVMRAGALAEKTYAETSFSADGQAQDREPRKQGKGGAGPLPQVPGLPGLPGLPIAGRSAGGASAGASSAKTASPGLPPELAALVDVGGYTSVSQTTYTPTLAATTSRAAVSDVTLLGGIVTLDSLKVKATTKSDGKAGSAQGSVQYGTLTVAGQRFTMGDEGFEAAGSATPIPGLPDDAAKALARLGVTVRVPKPTYEKKGDQAAATVAGLVFDIDTVALRKRLPALPLGRLVDAVPAEAGQLKSLLQAAANLSPRFVVTLGRAEATVDTVQPIPPAPAPAEPEAEEEGDGTKGAAGGGAGGGPAGGVGGGSSPLAGGVTPDGGVPSSAPADLVDAAPAASAAGLPKLFSIPGALFYGGLLAAGLLGSYLRRLGVLVLGAASSCSHGLDSGLPDLRKA